MGLNQSLAGKTQQPCQALGRDSHHAISTFFRPGNGAGGLGYGGWLTREESVRRSLTETVGASASEAIGAIAGACHWSDRSGRKAVFFG